MFIASVLSFTSEIRRYACTLMTYILSVLSLRAREHADGGTKRDKRTRPRDGTLAHHGQP